MNGFNQIDQVCKKNFSTLEGLLKPQLVMFLISVCSKLQHSTPFWKKKSKFGRLMLEKQQNQNSGLLYKECVHFFFQIIGRVIKATLIKLSLLTGCFGNCRVIPLTDLSTGFIMPQLIKFTNKQNNIKVNISVYTFSF